jgi:hypothetical protein
VDFGLSFAWNCRFADGNDTGTGTCEKFFGNFGSSASHGVGVPLPLTAAVMEIMQSLKVDGFEMEDHSSLVKYYEKLAKTEVKR